MDVRKTILAEKIYLKPTADKVTAYAAKSPENFKELMDCFFSNEYRLAQRAAWSVSYAARKKPVFVKPYLEQIAAMVVRTDVHDALIRNSVRILQEIELPEALHGTIMNACFAFIEKPSTPAAIKAFALTTLHNLSKTYPEIGDEIVAIIEQQWDNETPAFKSRGKKILEQLRGCKRKEPGVNNKRNAISDNKR